MSRLFGALILGMFLSTSVAAQDAGTLPGGAGKEIVAASCGI